jgi:hypothetical protein
MDMKDIPAVFEDIDLLWSEGSAYSIGFCNALTRWAGALASRGFLVVSELCWLTESPPEEAKEFFRCGYPDMHSTRENIAAAEDAGYEVLATHTLPHQAWVEGYYDILGPRARALREHPDATVREMAAETVREIDVFQRCADSYEYVFFVLQRT